jgi:hypothetical protein
MSVPRGKRIRNKQIDSDCSSPLSGNEYDHNDRFNIQCLDSPESNNDSYSNEKRHQSNSKKSPKTVRIQSESDDLLHDYTEKIKKLQIDKYKTNDHKKSENLKNEKIYFDDFHEAGERSAPTPSMGLPIGVPLLGKKTREALKDRIII